MNLFGPSNTVIGVGQVHSKDVFCQETAAFDANTINLDTLFVDPITGSKIQIYF